MGGAEGEHVHAVGVTREGARQAHLHRDGVREGAPANLSYSTTSVTDVNRKIDRMLRALPEHGVRAYMKGSWSSGKRGVFLAQGDPIAIDGIRMSPATLLTELNKVAGDNGGWPQLPLHGRANLHDATGFPPASNSAQTLMVHVHEQTGQCD